MFLLPVSIPTGNFREVIYKGINFLKKVSNTCMYQVKVKFYPIKMWLNTYKMWILCNVIINVHVSKWLP